jgi:hypothetical protein
MKVEAANERLDCWKTYKRSSFNKNTKNIHILAAKIREESFSKVGFLSAYIQPT